MSSTWRGLWGAGALAACAVLASSCGDTAQEEDVELDLETLEAETEFGTLEAERADDSFVGPINEGQAIGIAFLEDVVDEDDDLDDEVVVYLYQRDNIAILTGELEDDGTATLESNELSDFDATVELMMEDDAVTGTATFLEEDATRFRATPAADVGGVYWAEGTEFADEISGDWVVLPDERQWGCVCTPPTFTNPCCGLRF